MIKNLFFKTIRLVCLSTLALLLTGCSPLAPILKGCFPWTPSDEAVETVTIVETGRSITEPNEECCLSFDTLPFKLIESQM